MSPNTSPSAVVLPARLNLSGPGSPDLAEGMAVPRSTHRGRLRRLMSPLGDAAGILSLAFVFPLVVLAVGIPIALLVRLLLWLAGGL